MKEFPDNTIGTKSNRTGTFLYKFGMGFLRETTRMPQECLLMHTHYHVEKYFQAQNHQLLAKILNDFKQEKCYIRIYKLFHYE